MSEFDIHWPHGWQTTGGLPARLIALDLKGTYPYAFALLENESEVVRRYNEAGQCASSFDKMSLVNIPLPVRDGDEHLREALQKAEDDLDRVTRESNEFRRQRDEAFEALSKYASTLDDMGIALEASVIRIKEGGSDG